MMFLDPATKGLLWKEFRQLVPLLAMLIGVGIFLVLIAALAERSSENLYLASAVIRWALPLLFAVGAGAVLVGQEKEQATVLWLRSLPIAPIKIVGFKIAAAIIGLVTIWCFSAVLAAMIRIGVTDLRPNLPGAQAARVDSLTVVPIWLYLLGCGFLTAWWFENVFASLIAIVPISMFPYGAVSALDSLEWSVYRVNRTWRVADNWTNTVPLAVLAIFIGLVYWLALVVGRKRLSPAKPPRLEKAFSPYALHLWRPVTAASAATVPFRYPISSIVWQMMRHSTWQLLGIGCLMLIGFLAIPQIAELTNSRDEYRVWLTIAEAVGWLATMGLGVIVFAGDGNARHIRFLADRGISPLAVWGGRQLVAISLLSLGVLAYALAITARLYSSEFIVPLPSVAMFALIVWLTYTIAQWTSQLLSMVGLSVVLAPVLAITGLYWLVFAAVELSAPLWLLILCSCLPLLATLVSMRRFMDGNQAIRRWVFAAVSAILFVATPVIPFAVAVVRRRACPTTRASVCSAKRRESNSRVPTS